MLGNATSNTYEASILATHKHELDQRSRASSRVDHTIIDDILEHDWLGPKSGFGAQAHGHSVSIDSIS